MLQLSIVFVKKQKNISRQNVGKNSHRWKNIFRQICANKSAPIIEFHRIWQVKNTYSSGASWGDYSQLSTTHLVDCSLYHIHFRSWNNWQLFNNYFTKLTRSWFLYVDWYKFFCYKDNGWVIGNCVKFLKKCMVFYWASLLSQACSSNLPAVERSSEYLVPYL